MSAKSKTYSMRIRDAESRNRPDIADEVRKERDASYANDIYKLAREFKAALKQRNYTEAKGTLDTLINSAHKKVTGLGVEG